METFSALLALCAGNSPISSWTLCQLNMLLHSIEHTDRPKPHDKFFPVNSPYKGQWRGTLMFSLIYAWINDRVNNREAGGDLRRHHGHRDVDVMFMREHPWWSTAACRPGLCGPNMMLISRHNRLLFPVIQRVKPVGNDNEIFRKPKKHVKSIAPIPRSIWNDPPLESQGAKFIRSRLLYHKWVWNRGICMCVIVHPRSHMLIVLKKVIPDTTRYDFA